MDKLAQPRFLARQKHTASMKFTEWVLFAPVIIAKLVLNTERSYFILQAKLCALFLESTMYLVHAFGESVFMVC